MKEEGHGCGDVGMKEEGHGCGDLRAMFREVVVLVEECKHFLRRLVIRQRSRRHTLTLNGRNGSIINREYGMIVDSLTLSMVSNRYLPKPSRWQHSCT